jgi:hypothetical protein
VPPTLRAGNLRLLRTLALTLASISSPDPRVNWTSLAVEEGSASRWLHQARRLASLAIAVLESSSSSSSASSSNSSGASSSQQQQQEQEQLAALPACAARLVAALHNPGAWRCFSFDDNTNAGNAEGNTQAAAAAPAAAAAAARALLDPSTPDGAKQHARLCAAVASLAAKGDPVAAALAPIVFSAAGLTATDAGAGASAGGAGLRAVVSHLLTVSLLHQRLPAAALAPLAAARNLSAVLALVRAPAGGGEQPLFGGGAAPGGAGAGAGVRGVSAGAAGARAGAAAEVGGTAHPPEVWVLDNLLALVTGWKARGGPGTGAGAGAGGRSWEGLVDRGGVVATVSEARARLAAFAASSAGAGGGGGGAEALAGAARSLIGRLQARGEWNWGGLRDVRLVGALGCLEEVWFLMGLARGGEGAGSGGGGGGGARSGASPSSSSAAAAASSSGGPGAGGGSRRQWTIGDDGGGAAVSLYWQMLAGAAPADTRQLLGACAFAPGFLPWLWRRLAVGAGL